MSCRGVREFPHTLTRKSDAPEVSSFHPTNTIAHAMSEGMPVTFTATSAPRQSGGGARLRVLHPVLPLRAFCQVPGTRPACEPVSGPPRWWLSSAAENRPREIRASSQFVVFTV